MARFFFHIRDHDRLIEDRDGLEFSDPGTATAEYMEAAREILRESGWYDQPLAGRAFQIVDETGSVVLELSFAAVVNWGMERKRRADRRR